MIRSLFFLLCAATCTIAQATSDKKNFDDQMVKNAQAANEQISNLKLDNYTRLRGVFYERESSSFIYYYLTSFPKEHARFKLDVEQAKDLSMSLISKTCNGPFKEYISAPYYVKVLHIYNDKQTNDQYHKTSVGIKECEALDASNQASDKHQDFALLLSLAPENEKTKYQKEPWHKCSLELIEKHPPPSCYTDTTNESTKSQKCDRIPVHIEELSHTQTKRSKTYELLFTRGKFRKTYECELSLKGSIIQIN